MKLWQRPQSEVNSWQAVAVTRFGMAMAIIGVIVIFIEIFHQPGTQYGLGVVGIGAGLTGAGDALATYETKIGQGK